LSPIVSALIGIGVSIYLDKKNNSANQVRENAGKAVRDSEIKVLNEISNAEQDSKPPATVGPTATVKWKLSAAGRRAIIAGTKKRGAAIKAAKAAAEELVAASVTPKAAPAKAPVPVKKGGLTETKRFGRGVRQIENP
jgi:nucleoid-associated protein YgaU